MAKIQWAVAPTINSCRDNLMLGNIGQVEYHLHKDNSWIAQPYKSEDEKQSIVAELKENGYRIDKVVDFNNTLNLLTRNINIQLN